MIKVLAVGQTPPPYHGQGIAIERIVKAGYRGLKLYHVRMGFSKDIQSVGRFRLGKLWELVRVIAEIAYFRVRHGARILYYPPAPPRMVPLVRDLAILGATRWMFQKTIFHFHAHGLTELYPRLGFPWRGLFRRAYGRPDATIESTDLAGEDGRRLGAGRQYVIPLGTDDPATRAPAACDDRPARVLFMGILSEQKGILVLLEACGELGRRGIAFDVDVVGAFQSKRFEGVVRGAVARWDLRQRVRFCGELSGEEKRAAFARASLLCWPTFHPTETFGLVLIEAMSFGLPVVAARWAAAPAIVDDGVNGYLVEPADAEALADRLAQLLENPRLRGRMSRHAREKYLREYTASRFVARIERALKEVACR